MKTVMIENISLQELVEKIQIIMTDSLGKANPKDVNRDKLLTRKETAELLKVSLVTLNNWAKLRILIPLSIGNRIYYRMDDILKSAKPIYTNHKINN